MKLEEAQHQEKRHHLGTYARLPLVVASGHGARLVDEDGKSYLDFLGGIAVNALGHGHPDVVKALEQAIRAPLHVSNLYLHPTQIRAARGLCELTGYDRVFFTNSGTESNEAALKMARLRAHRTGDTKRTRFVALQSSFHGRSMGALSLTWPKAYREPYEPLVPGVTFVPPNDVAALEEAITDETAAFVFEAIQGEGGLAMPETAFLQRAQSLCRERGALLWADEIQCGLGRTGRVFGFQRAEVDPDLVTLAKPLGLGLPLGALLLKEDVARHVKPGDHGTTFGGNPLACRLTEVLLDHLSSRRLLEHVATVGAHLKARLETLRERHACVVEVRGEGLMAGIACDRDPSWIVQHGFDNGYLMNRTAATVLRFLPPLIVTRDEVDEFTNFLDGALEAFRKQGPQEATS